MATLIKNRAIAADSWQLLEAGADGAAPSVPLTGDVVVPLALWKAEKAALSQHLGRTGVLLEPADDPSALAGETGQLPLIAVRFPKFPDGRGYSTARLLRERHGFRGELRAIGDVLRDQLSLMERCGFDSYLLRDDQNVAEALAAFEDFSEAYQASVEQPIPLFRRRAQTTNGA